jgi:hypothetical protein
MPAGPKNRKSWSRYSREFKVDRATLQRRCEERGYSLDSRKFQLKAVADDIRSKPKGPQGIDPVTGLPWAQAHKREQALRERLERTELEKRQSVEWVAAEKHYRTLTRLCDRLELAPGRIKSQLGLSESQKSSIQKVIDDIRTEFVKDKESKGKPVSAMQLEDDILTEGAGI